MRHIVIFLIIAAGIYFIYRAGDHWMKYVSLAPAAPVPGANSTTDGASSGDDAQAFKSILSSLANSYQASTPPAGAALAQRVAWKEVARTNNAAFPNVEVAVMDGNRWRLEAKRLGAARTAVAVCDGSATVANPPPRNGSPATLDPRPQANTVLNLARRISALAARMPNQATEPLDGRACWKISEDFQGLNAQLWVDSRTGFPVCLVAVGNGGRTEAHFSRVPFDFAHGGDFFDTKNTDPMLANYLTDALPVPQAP